MESYAFAIDERPLRIWDWNLREKNLDFLRGVDPEYFVHVAQVNAGVLEQQKDHRAALAIRLAYSHALETFMAFAAATFQAPACPIGWVLRYSNEDLRSVIRKVTRGQLEFQRLSAPSTWEGLAETHVGGLTATPEQKAAISSGFARLWRRLAHDFLDESQETEYNSLKHGMRVAAGGFVLRFGREPSYGQKPPDEAMTLIGGSEYGSSYFIIEKPVGGKIDFRPRRFSRNWHPENLFHGLQVLALSLGNTVSYLRARAGEDVSQLRFQWPDDPAAFDSPWTHHLGVTTSNFDLTLVAEHIRASTKEEVLKEIRNAQRPIQGSNEPDV